MSGPLAETNKKNMVDLVRPPLCRPLLLLPSHSSCILSVPTAPSLPWALVGALAGPDAPPPTHQVNTHHLHSSSDDEDDRLKEFNFPEEAVLQQVGLWGSRVLPHLASPWPTGPDRSPWLHLPGLHGLPDAAHDLSLHRSLWL